MFDSHVWKEHARRDLPAAAEGALAHVRGAESKRKFQEAHEHRCLDSSSQVHSVHRSSEDDALAWLCLAEVLAIYRFPIANLRRSRKWPQAPFSDQFRAVAGPESYCAHPFDEVAKEPRRAAQAGFSPWPGGPRGAEGWCCARRRVVYIFPHLAQECGARWRSCSAWPPSARSR